MQLIFRQEWPTCTRVQRQGVDFGLPVKKWFWVALAPRASHYASQIAIAEEEHPFPVRTECRIARIVAVAGELGYLAGGDLGQVKGLELVCGALAERYPAAIGRPVDFFIGTHDAAVDQPVLAAGKIEKVEPAILVEVHDPLAVR